MAEVEIEFDLKLGFTARASDIDVRMGGVLDRRPFTTDDFMLDGVPHALQLVLAPMREASITEAGAPVEGVVMHGGTTDRPSSSAFVTVAEVWSTVG